MASRDPNFISNKLSELKRSALQQNSESHQMASPYRATQYNAKQYGYGDDNGAKKVTYSMGRSDYGGGGVEQDARVPRMQRDYPAQSNAITLDEYKRRLEQDNYGGSGKKETYLMGDSAKKYDTNPQRVAYTSYGYEPATNTYKSNIDEPRVVRARNVQTPTASNLYDNLGHYYNGGNVSYGGMANRQAQSYSVDKFKQTAPVTYPNTSVMHNNTATALADRYKVNMTDDLNGRLQECSEINRKLRNEVDQLKRTFEAEKTKVAEIEKMCQDDLEDVRKREREVNYEFEDMQKRQREKAYAIKKHEEQSSNVSLVVENRSRQGEARERAIEE